MIGNAQLEFKITEEDEFRSFKKILEALEHGEIFIIL